MTRSLFVPVALVLTLAGGCKHKKPDALADKGSDDPVHTAVPAPDAEKAAAVEQLMRNFQRVHFETDSARLTADGKAALSENAELLTTWPELRVEVQGHADERGTIDYNLALGQRRALAVVDHLSALGVAPSRLPTVSYGEERPVDDHATEVAWSRNRRAEFRVLGATLPVEGTTER